MGKSSKKSESNRSLEVAKLMHLILHRTESYLVMNERNKTRDHHLI